jgi:hypothetical protein
MNFKTVLFGSLIVTLGIFGCDKGATATNAPADVNAPKLDANTPAKPVESEVDQSKVPAVAKTDAYDYYGLGNSEPRKYTTKGMTGGDGEATQVLKLIKADENMAEYTLSFTGTMEKLGSTTLRAEKSGVLLISNDQFESVGANYELPQGIAPGKTWDSNMKSKGDGGFVLNSTNKVVGTTTITTPVATYKDAILVVNTGSGTQGKDKFEMITKMWLVKGRGSVKSEMVQKAGGKTQTVILEEAK